SGWLGILIGFTGTAALILGESKDLSINIHAVYILLSAASGAIFMVLQRNYTRRYNSFAIVLWVMWLGTLFMLPYLPTLISELRAASTEAWLAGLYLGVFPTGLAYVTWGYVLSRLPAARAASLLYFVPPMAFFFAWLIIGDRPSLLAIISGLIVIAGVFLVNRSPRQPAKRADDMTS
ncbi:MAG: DMT family transporter, partial [Gammaproteobacteria bacterium]|nr:DMT family transporter [Gammaproteobacteria bacterium]